MTESKESKTLNLDSIKRESLPLKVPVPGLGRLFLSGMTVGNLIALEKDLGKGTSRCSPTEYRDKLLKYIVRKNPEETQGPSLSDEEISRIPEETREQIQQLVPVFS